MDANTKTELKRLTEKKTLLEAKIELGKRLALVYSAANDDPAQYGVDIFERWQVTMDKRGYTVSRCDVVWSGMTFAWAMRHVVNPAHKMIESGAIEPGQMHWAMQKGYTDYHSVLRDRVILMHWIDPNQVGLLEKEALEHNARTNEERRVKYEERRQALKQITYDKKTGNKPQDFETGHATFDKQTNALGTGNTWANTMHGGCIRPYQETYCNYRFWAPGELQLADLEFYQEIHTPNHILDAVKVAAKDQMVHFYALFSWYTPTSQYRGGEPRRVVHGYILTDYNDILLRSWNTGPGWKSGLVIDGVLPYLARYHTGAILAQGEKICG